MLWRALRQVGRMLPGTTQRSRIARLATTCNRVVRVRRERGLSRKELGDAVGLGHLRVGHIGAHDHPDLISPAVHPPGAEDREVRCDQLR